MKKLPAVSEMEHITSREFGENMDAILERVAKEDVALIIEGVSIAAYPADFPVEPLFIGNRVWCVLFQRHAIEELVQLFIGKGRQHDQATSCRMSS